MSALAWSGIHVMECHSPELDHERRFLAPPRWREPSCAPRGPSPSLGGTHHYPHAFTRTTYFDTEELSLLASRDTGFAQRLRLRSTPGRWIWRSLPS